MKVIAYATISMVSGQGMKYVRSAAEVMAAEESAAGFYCDIDCAPNQIGLGKIYSEQMVDILKEKVKTKQTVEIVIFASLAGFRPAAMELSHRFFTSPNGKIRDGYIVKNFTLKGNV